MHLNLKSKLKLIQIQTKLKCMHQCSSPHGSFGYLARFLFPAAQIPRGATKSGGVFWGDLVDFFLTRLLGRYTGESHTRSPSSRQAQGPGGAGHRDCEETWRPHEKGRVENEGGMRQTSRRLKLGRDAERWGVSRGTDGLQTVDMRGKMVGQLHTLRWL